MSRLWILTALVLGAIGATCKGGGTGPGDDLRAELEAARERWEDRGFTDYALTLQRDCFCPETHRGPVVVNVRSRQVQTRIYQATGEPVPSEPAQFFPDVDGLFAFLEDAIDRDAYQIRAEFHPELGYPTQIFVDFESLMADEEQGYQTLSLEPLP